CCDRAPNGAAARQRWAGWPSHSGLPLREVPRRLPSRRTRFRHIVRVHGLPRRGSASKPNVGAQRLRWVGGTVIASNSNGVAPDSIPNIAFIPWDLVLLQEHTQLVLEAAPAMVFFLSSDIFSHLLQIGLTHGETGITALPLKISVLASLFLQPTIGYTFYFLHPFRLRDRPTKATKQMHVVFNSTDEDRRQSRFFETAPR